MASLPPQPTKLWQWILLYPALLITALGAIPTVIQTLRAWRYDTTYNKVQLIEEQHRLWWENTECLGKRMIYEVDGPQGLVVGVTLCPSGAALLRYKWPEHEAVLRWVGAPSPGAKNWPNR